MIEFEPLKPTWRWYVFGGKDTPFVPVLVDLVHEVSFVRRAVTRIFLGSQWERL